MTESCLGCDKRPDVYGSTWCSACQDTVPERAKRRMITMRNALLDIESWSGRDPAYVNEVASEALRPGSSASEGH